ncbi:tetratricopeptide repeat protein, partial [Candidatus Azambacteria bacterium]|nr:tetratricopeptide repeat protein [Candidatus Azambacteria bacterium]
MTTQLPIRLFRIRRQTSDVQPPRARAESFSLRRFPPVGKELWGKIMRWSFFGAVFFLPLIILPWTLAPLNYAKTLAIGTLLFLGFLGWLGKSLAEGEVKLPNSWVSRGVGLWLFLMFVSAVFSTSHLASFRFFATEPDTFWNLLLFGLVFLLGSVTVEDREDFLKLFRILFLSLAVLAAFQIFQLFGVFLLPWGFTRLVDFNPVGTANGLAMYLAFGLALVVGYLVGQKPRGYLNVGLLALGAAILAVLILLNSIKAWPLVILAMVVILAYEFLGVIRGERRVRNVLLPLAVLVVALYFTFLDLPIRRPQVTPEASPNYQTTFKVLEGTWRARAILGSGPATFSYQWSTFHPREVNDTVFWGVRFTQGAAFLPSLAVTGGLLGVGALLLLLVFATWQGIRQVARRGESDLGGLALPIFLGGVTSFLSWFLYPGNFVILATGFLFLAFLSHLDGVSYWRKAFAASPAYAFLTSIALIFLMVASVSLLYLFGSRYVSAALLGKASPFLTLGADVDRGLGLLNTALRIDPSDERSWRALAQGYVVKLNATIQEETKKSSLAALPPEKRGTIQTFIIAATQAARQAAAKNPADGLNWSLIGSVYENILFFVDNAERFSADAYLKAKALEPMNPGVRLDFGRMYFLFGTKLERTGSRAATAEGRSEKVVAFENAEREFREALALKPDYTPAHFLLAQTLDRQGRRDEAILKGEEAKRLNPLDQGVAFQLGLLYYRAGRYEEAEQEFSRAVTVNLQYSNARYFLGLIYDRRGERTRALREFQQIDALNPGNEEVQKIILNLKAGRPALEGLVPPNEEPGARTETPLPERGSR